MCCVVAVASHAGCRFGFDPFDPAAADPGNVGADGVPKPQASDDRFAVTPPAFSVTSSEFVPVPGSQVELPARPVGRPWIVWLSATLGSTVVSEMSVEV